MVSVLILILGLSSNLWAVADQVQMEPAYNTYAADAFGRLRVGLPFTMFQSKELFQQESVYWTTSSSGAGAGFTFDSNFSSITLTSGTTSGAWSSYQTKTYWPYFPGKANSLAVTGNFFGGQTNVVKRIGYFDDNNGLFIQLSGTTLSAVIRSNTSGTPVDTVIPQSSWNIDRLDGTGPSGYNIDLTKSQIFYIDFQWLGVGKVRFGVQANAKPIFFHVSYNTNVNPGVYMQRPDLPIRYEIRNLAVLGSAPIMTKICCNLTSEGGEGNYMNSTVQSPLAGTAFAASQLLPLVAVRVKSGFTRGANFRPHEYVVGSTSAANGYVYVCYNPQISGGTWVSITNSALEYNNTATAITTTNTACVITHSDIVTNGTRSTGVGNVDPFLWANYDYNQTTPDVWALAVYNLAGNNTYFGSMGLEEYR